MEPGPRRSKEAGRFDDEETSGREFDRTFTALIEDLDRRGLLATTLVVCLGEFGRAPRVALEATFAGRTPGRKHWAAVYSGVFAGAAVARGAVLGASDKQAGQPASQLFGPSQ